MEKSANIRSRLPTVAAAAMALLTTTAGANGAGVPSAVTAKRQNEDDQTPALVLAPPDTSILVADHSSHASHESHSSHYSSSDGGDDYVPPPAYIPPVTTAPSYVPPDQAPAPPPVQTQSSQVKQLDSVLLNKLSQVPSLWPKQVMLIQEFAFTKIRDGVAVGLIGAPPGTQVDLISVESTKLIVAYMGNRAEIDASVTDIGDRVDEAALVSAPLPPPTSTNAAPSTPPTTDDSTPKAALPSHGPTANIS